MKVIWNGQKVDAVLMVGEFRLDTGQQIFTHLDGEYILSTSHGQIVVREDELQQEDKREFYPEEVVQGYQDIANYDTEEDDDYIEALRSMNT